MAKAIIYTTSILSLVVVCLFLLGSATFYHAYRTDQIVMGARHTEPYLAWLRSPGSVMYRR